MAYDEERTKEIVKGNVEYLMETHKIKTQKEFAEVIGVSTAQLCHVIKKDQLPSLFPFLNNIEKKFGYTIDEFLSLDLNKYDPFKINDDCIPVENIVKFEGIYLMYIYNDTGMVRLGSLRADDDVKCGLLVVHRKTDSGYCVTALMNLKRAYAECHFRKMKDLTNGGGYANAYYYLLTLSSGYGAYHGEMELSEENCSISLKNTWKNENAILLFNRPEPGVRKFAGGMGILASTFDGAKALPCTRYVGLTSECLSYSGLDISKQLLLEPFDMSAEMICNKMGSVFDVYDKMKDNPDIAYEDRKMLACIKINNVFKQMWLELVNGGKAITKEINTAWCDYIAQDAA